MNTEKIAKVFTQEFIQNNKDLDNLDDIYAAVVAEGTPVSREEFDEFIDVVSEGIEQGDELSESSLEGVAGGVVGWATVGGVIGLLTFSYKAGEKIGQAIAHRKNSKKK